MAKHVLCGRAVRNEKHEPHFWRCQTEDDVPNEKLAFCESYLPEGQ